MISFSGQVQHIMQLGADWVFLYEPSNAKVPPAHTFNRLMIDLSRLQRMSPVLLQAVYDGRLQVVRKLLANGADPNCLHCSTGPWGAPHLVHFSRQQKHVQAAILDELRHHGADFELGTTYPKVFLSVPSVLLRRLSLSTRGNEVTWLSCSTVHLTKRSRVRVPDISTDA